MKKAHIEKTNAMRELESARIEYEWREYKYDENDLSGKHAAECLCVSDDIIFKTLVTRACDGAIGVFVIPVSGELDMKKAAKAFLRKNVQMLPVKELPIITGYIRGGCSPIGMKKRYRTYIDETALIFDKIYISAGKRGINLIISPKVLAEFISAEFADLTK